MRPRRIYLPLTHDQLRALAADRSLVAPLEGYAAGSPGRVDARISPAAAQEEAEYVAFLAAASHAAQLGRGDRRVIASADVPESTVREGPAPQPGSAALAVLLVADLPLRAVASLHVDEEMEEGDEGEEPDLLWYDITELESVVEDLGLKH